MLILAPTFASAQSPPKPAEGYNAFRLLRTRNVFDPERRAAVSDVAPPKPPPTVTRANFIALTGTMVSREKSLAFFTGSRPELSKVITVGDTIADFKVTAITGTQVEMTLAGKPPLTVLVGRQVPLTGSSVVTGPPPTLPDPTATATPPAANAPASDKNETLRRMMEARQKEMSK